MARELVLIPKVKYQELIKYVKNQEDDASTRSDPRRTETTKTGPDVIKNSENSTVDTDDDDELETENNSSNVTATNVSNKPPRRRNKRRSQKGGKLFVKSTPHQFIRKLQTKRKWKLFKV